ncbi:hypothetical protein F5X99DRAFT_419231 [Biscogniauxia marginata]|nr:hypothetical protein F5X99DRAFT_419231 [Biscogniauxia marginata]
MADVSFAPASTSTGNAAGRASENAPSGFTLRRAATVGQPTYLRRRPTVNASPPLAAENSFAGNRRRSSLYSDFETSADDIFNPSRSSAEPGKKSPFAYVPLTLALLPALAGMLFENGSAFFTDLILLSLAAVFLHWSVTQPWDWYQSAQQVRIVKDEIMTEPVFDSDSDAASSGTPSATTAPEESGKQKEPEGSPEKSPRAGNKQWEARQAAAIRELYVHEMLALVWCFISPMLGAYLLHTIRGQLTRPSEGLVSDYNLTIFLCAAEVRPVSHLIRMLQDRTLRVQQIVAQNPHTKRTVTVEQFEALHSRLEELEAHTASNPTESNSSATPSVPQRVIETAVGREVRSTIQPELDALNRAMRRYEKKLTLLACQTDNRIEYVDYRLNDAIALAAVAAKNSNARWGLATWLVDKTTSIVVVPIQAALAVFTFPFRTLSTLFNRKRRPPPPAKAQRSSSKNGKLAAQGRSSADRDRVPTRVPRR